MNNRIFNQLTICLLSVFLFVSCSKKDDNPDPDGNNDAKAEITATLQFSSGESVDFAFTHKKDDLIKPYINGPNRNDHYKLWLRGEKEIDGFVYVINLYVTMPEAGVGDYPFGRAWQWHDEGFVTEIHVGVTEKGSPLNLKQYSSLDADNTTSKGVTISSLTDNHVTGTFSGIAAYTESDIVIITDGEFNIDINRGDWED